MRSKLEAVIDLKFFVFCCFCWHRTAMDLSDYSLVRQKLSKSQDFTCTNDWRGFRPSNKMLMTRDSTIEFPWFPHFLFHCQKQPWQTGLVTGQVDVVVRSAPWNQLDRVFDKSHINRRCYCRNGRIDVAWPLNLGQNYQPSTGRSTDNNRTAWRWTILIVLQLRFSQPYKNYQNSAISSGKRTEEPTSRYQRKMKLFMIDLCHLHNTVTPLKYEKSECHAFFGWKCKI